MKREKSFYRVLSIVLAAFMIIGVLAIPSSEANAAKKKSASYVTKIKAAKKSVTVKAKKSVSVKITVKGGKKASKKFTAKSNKSKIATAKVVGNKVKITGKKAGKAVITVTTKGKNSKKKKLSAKIKVTVKAAAKKTPKTTEAKDSVTISQTSANMNTGDYIELTLSENGSTITDGVTWAAQNTTTTPKVPSGDAGLQPLEVVHVRTSTKMADRGKAFVIAEYNGASKITATYNGKTYSCDVKVSNGFNVTTDMKITPGTTSIFVDFDLKRGSDGKFDPEEIRELREQGCTVDEDSGRVTKNQRCETAKYTFTKLPKTVEEIKSVFLNAEQNDTSDQKAANTAPNYGGFNAMAASICAANAFTWTRDPSNVNYENCPQGWEFREMCEFINGPFEDDNIAEVNFTQAISSLKDGRDTAGDNAYKSFFKGATSKNNYTPSVPYEINMYKGPYFIESKETITGERPDTYMILVPGRDTNCNALKDVACEGFASDKYIDVWYSNTDKRWYSFQNNFMHVTENQFKPATKSR